MLIPYVLPSGFTFPVDPTRVFLVEIQEASSGDPASIHKRRHLIDCQCMAVQLRRNLQGRLMIRFSPRLVREEVLKEFSSFLGTKCWNF